MSKRWQAWRAQLFSRFTGHHGDPTPEKRQCGPRLALGVQVVCRVGRRQFPAELLDISESGLRLRLSEALTKDDTVFVTSDSMRQQVNCRVAWCHGKEPDIEVGVEFNASDENSYHEWMRQASLH
ncbi:PilZ domain-containing protein [bacterium]|nr:PilZ domain-containing protein [bacterium]